MNIRDKIVEQRMRRIAARGRAQGLSLPSSRGLPLVSFAPAEDQPFVICEIKRHSPSKGAIDENLDPVRQAGLYLAGGACFLSVLTEEAYFHGSLADLMAVKKAYPQAAVLRKDFLLDAEDVEVSFRAGADAVLLIAAMLDTDALQKMYERALSLGMAALVEVHSAEDVRKVKKIGPPLMGVNSRNLETFTLDLLRPPVIRSLCDWPAKTVFESGITGQALARFAGSLGFDGILVGEAAVRSPAAVPALIQGLCEGKAAALRSAERGSCAGFFWNALSCRLGRPEALGGAFPLVKICGLTNLEDVRAADSLGADILGFVFAQSPRRAHADFAASLPKTRALKAGVIVPRETGGAIDPRIAGLVKSGALDVLQIHGPFEELAGSSGLLPGGIPAYGVLQPSGAEEAAALIREYQASGSAPRFLLDACAAGMAGGTGKTLSPEIPDAAALSGPLWLAGGITPGNVRDMIQRWKPELIDLSSGVEALPGKKDHAKLRELFRKVNPEGYIER
jgi:indole-3-glycerol phosphate synthase/phosphoribosylanthranilate isomerase